MTKGRIIFLISAIALLISEKIVCAQSAPLQDYTSKWQIFVPSIPRPVEHEKDTVRLVFIGDFMMHAKQLGMPCATFIEGLKPLFRNADFSVANMEFTLAGPPYSGYPAFSAPDSIAFYAAGSGINVFLTANNHILDKGTDGAVRTAGIYTRMEEDGIIRFTGMSDGKDDRNSRYPLILRSKGISIALINFTYGTNVNTSDTSRIRINRADKTEVSEAFDRAGEAGADMIVALPHWGEEYELRHNGYQENWAKWLCGKGAGLIVGAHPHVVQDSTTLDGTPVFYSIGNAVSNMSAANTRLEMAVTATITREFPYRARVSNTKVDFLWCTLPGTLTDSYATIIVKDYIGKRHLWKRPADYDNMMSTYMRVKNITGIKDN